MHRVRKTSATVRQNSIILPYFSRICNPDIPNRFMSDVNADIKQPATIPAAAVDTLIYLLIFTFMVIAVPGVFVPCPSNLTYIVSLLVVLHP